MIKSETLSYTDFSYLSSINELSTLKSLELNIMDNKIENIDFLNYSKLINLEEINLCL